MAKKHVLFFSFFCFLFASHCSVKEKWHKSTFIYFDTVCEINIFCLPSRFEACQEEVRKKFSEIEMHFSPGVHDYASPIVINLFHKALTVYHDSKGSFDITVAPLSRIWGFSDKSFAIPSEYEIKSALKHIGMDKIKEEQGTLVLSSNMELDWGGIAKGLGIDLAYKSLVAMGISRGFINAGGDLFCWGKNPDNQKWKIGIKHPRKSGYLGILSITDLGAATTGDYQRYFEVNGFRYHHVFNPQTGYPVQGKQSITVIGPETILCDALSTALFVSSSPEEILKIYPDYGAIIVNSDGKISILGKGYIFRLI